MKQTYKFKLSMLIFIYGYQIYHSHQINNKIMILTEKNSCILHDIFEPATVQSRSTRYIQRQYLQPWRLQMLDHHARRSHSDHLAETRTPRTHDGYSEVILVYQSIKKATIFYLTNLLEICIPIERMYG